MHLTSPRCVRKWQLQWHPEVNYKMAPHLKTHYMMCRSCVKVYDFIKALYTFNSHTITVS